MKLNNKVLSSIVAIGLVLGLTTAWADDHAASSGLVGTWALEVSAMRGIQYLTLEVIEEAGGYGGVVTGRRGPVIIEAIQVKGRAFSFRQKVTSPMGKIELLYTGQIDTDRMQGEMQTPRGAIMFTGKRTQ
ncbi:MAG: hypothetical protein KC524_13330 [Gammaproteobacteria bacterium]|jgi:hypothetical protein|nr:hypothetical protein [Gammaproteobacteria bacterium]MDB2328466.1 hypothetical protein [Pseudomonadales bacterium]